MTTLGAARCHETGDIYYCSDTLISSGNIRLASSKYASKFVVGKNCVVGFSGSSAFFNVVKNEFSNSPPSFIDSSDPYTFLEGFHDLLGGKGRFNFDRQVSGSDYINFNGLFLSNKGIFTIYGNFTYVGHDSFAFAGSGEEFALGAFEALTRAEYGSTRECLEESVNIATKFDSSSGGKLITAKLCVDK